MNLQFGPFHSLGIKWNSPDSFGLVFDKDFFFLVDNKSLCPNIKVEGISSNTSKGFNTKDQDQVERKSHK